jgi:hypothetical protein
MRASEVVSMQCVPVDSRSSASLCCFVLVRFPSLSSGCDGRHHVHSSDSRTSIAFACASLHHCTDGKRHVGLSTKMHGSGHGSIHMSDERETRTQKAKHREPLATSVVKDCVLVCSSLCVAVFVCVLCVLVGKPVHLEELIACLKEAHQWHQLHPTEQADTTKGTQ